MRLTIITINYNNCRGLKKTIESILCQTWRDFEWIVIDGGSTDGSKELIEQYQDHFTYWCSEPDKGIYNAMNKGIIKAKGDYLNFMNSGDSFHSSDVLEKVFSINIKSDILYGDANRIDKEKENIHLYPRKLSIHYLLTDGFCHQATFIKTSLLKNGGYREDYKIIADWYHFIKWFRQGKSFSHTGFVIADYDMSGLSANSHELLLQETYRMYDDIFGKENRKLIEESVAMQHKWDSYDNEDLERAFRIKEYGGQSQKWIFHWLLKLLNKTF